MFHSVVKPDNIRLYLVKGSESLLETEIFYQRLGQKLKDLRKSKGFTQEQLGEYVGLTKSAIVNYESGIRKIPLDIVSKLADFHAVSIDSLFDREKTLQNVLESNLSKITLSERQEQLLVGFIEILLGVNECGKSNHKKQEQGQI